jgi:DNA-binding NarL/FixJ family response regulator
MEDSPTLGFPVSVLYFAYKITSCFRILFLKSGESLILILGVSMITTLLVDDHAYIRNGIQTLLEAAADIQVVAAVSNGIEAVAKARLLEPDMVIIDISMPFMSGIEATQHICASCPRTRVLALSIYENVEYIRSALEAGAYGYVLKDNIADELLDAIYSLHRGQRYFSQKIAAGFRAYIEKDDNISAA